jgi:hypothetical protein
MAPGYWHEVLSRGLAVPDDRPLGDLTAELTTMLGSSQPELRDGTAYPTLATWIERGVYDDLLTGLGDGMAAGLTVGLGERGTDTVFRRSFSALVLGECLQRENSVRLLPAGKVLEWGDRVATWYLWERDVRGYVPGKGWAHAIAHGADAIGVLAGSHHLGSPELRVLLDVLAERLADRRCGILTAAEPDRMAAAAMTVLRRNLLTLEQVEAWVARVATGAATLGGTADRDPYLDSADRQAFLRSLYLQVSLGPEPPAIRSDLILVLVDALQRTNPHHLRPRP